MKNNASPQRRLVTLFALLMVLIGAIRARAQESSTRPAITPDNATQVTRLALLGRGWLNGIGWSPDGQTLVLAGSAGAWLYDASRFDAPPRLLETHSSTWTVAYSPDGALLATGGRDSMVRLWDTSAITEGDVVSAVPLREIACRPGRYGGPVRRVTFSPDGSLLACAGSSVMVFDTATGEEVAVLSAGGESISAANAVFSPDGRVLATPEYLDGFHQWDAHTFEPSEDWSPSYKARADDIAYSPDGSLLAIEAGGVQVHDATTGERLQSFEHPAGHFFSLDFGPNGMLVAAGSFGLVLWDVETGEKWTLFGDADWVERYGEDYEGDWVPFPEYHDVIGAAFSPDGKYLAAVDASGHAYVWDMTSGERLATLGGYSMGGAARGGASSDWINITALAFAPDGKTLAAGTGGYVTSGGWVELWDVETQTLRGFLPGGGTMQGLAYNPTGTVLATSTAYSGVQLWDTTTHDISTGLFMPGGTERVAFSPDGAHLAADMYWKLVVWDVATGEQLWAMDTGESGADYAQGVAYSPDGALLATGGPNASVALWDPITGEQLAILESDIISIHDVTFSPVPFAGDPVGWLLAAATGWDEGTARLWAVRRDGDGVAAAELAVLQGGINRVVFSPDGRLLGTGNESGVAQLWDTATFELLGEFEGHAESVTSLAFSPDGTLLATGGWDGTIRLWGISNMN